METIAVYCENCKKHETQTVWAEGGVSNVTAGDSHAVLSALKGYSTVTEQQQGANTFL
jgi:hypothetical protein